MGYVGTAALALGAIGIAVSTKGQRDWLNWNHRQRVGALVSAALMISGLILMDSFRP